MTQQELERAVCAAICAGNGLRAREIAAKLGRTPKSVDNTIQRIKRKLKDFFD